MNEIFTEPTEHKEKMAKLQINLFNSAIGDILKQASKAFNETNEVFTLRSLFQVTGEKVQNILEIHKDSKIFIVTDKTYFKGVQF